MIDQQPGAGQSTVRHRFSQRRQTRRAWLALSVAFTTFLLICVLVGSAGYWYRGHATEKRSVRVELVQGDRAFVRPALQRNWNAIPPRSSTSTPLELHEGDTIQTKAGAQLLLTLWDNSTVQIFENTELVLTELRSTQYISRASSVTLTQTNGLTYVALASGDYYRSRFQVVAGNTTVVMKEGDGSAGGVFVVQVIPTDPSLDNSSVTVRASVRRGTGAVRVQSYPGELRLEANQQTIVPPDQPAGAPTEARRDFVANSQFGTIGATGCDLKEQFAPWVAKCTPGLIDGGFGRLTIVAETLDNMTIGALEITRSLNSTDPANTGVRQDLNVGVSEQAGLQLTADLKVFEQTVPGGGQAGSEFPIIVRINYYDASNGLNNRIWGFYLANTSNGTVPPNPSLVEARPVQSEEWVALRFNLRELVPQPVRLESIEVYASGQGYRARITNVAIIGTE